MHSPTTPTPAPASADPTPQVVPPSFYRYTVRSGDTAQGISRRFYGVADHWHSVMRANPKTDFQKLRVGQEILVPVNPRNVQGLRVPKEKADATADGAKAGGKAKREPKPKAGGKESTRGPSGLDVAAQMLKDAGTPLKCKEMVEQMLAKGLWATNGKTPAATIYAAIIREIAEKGKEARFTKTDHGTFAFNASAEKKGA